MIVSLSGKLIEAAIFRAVIECAGVGYEVNIPVSTAEKLPRIGENVRLFTLQTFREDGQTLYGFHSAEERDFFKLLVEKVSGIGPGIALKIFSRLSLPVLRGAIRNGDVGSRRERRRARQEKRRGNGRFRARGGRSRERAVRRRRRADVAGLQARRR